MSRSEWTQSAFVAGEWSPFQLGRTELPRYQQCASALENWITMIQGGARSRWGTGFVAEVADSTKLGRLVPFRFSNSQTYVIEFGNATARFYSQNGRIESSPGVPVQISTPWTSGQLVDLEWAQYADTAIFAHPSTVPYRLTRVSSLLWKLQAAPFVVFPSEEIGKQYAADITISNGVGITVTATVGAPFLASDVGRQIIADLGEATITGFTSSTQVTATASGFLAGAYTAGNWTLTESPKTTVTFAGNNRLNGTGTLTAAAAAWRNADVGDYVVMNDGQLQITSFSTTTVVNVKVVDVLTNPTTPADAAAWALEPRTWSSARGYPRAVALAEQRLIFGGSLANPVDVWASATGFPYNLARGVRAASGFTLKFWGGDMSTIMHLVPTPTTLIALTASAELSAGTGNDDAMTPSNVHPRPGSNNGCSAARPTIVNNDLVYVQDGGTRVRALAFRSEENAFWASDITKESEHLFRAGVTELAYCKDPYPVLYARLGDGRLAACSISRQVGVLEHDVLAWSPISTDGQIESIAPMRYGAEDQLWMIVNRTISGVTKRYVERADWNLNTDCALTGTSATATATWSGFGHLEGKELQVLGDGCELANQVVVGGNIRTAKAGGTLGADRPSLAIEAGLPFVSTLTVPDLEPIGASFGGARVKVNEAIVDLVDTIGLEIQGHDLKWRTFGADAFTSPPLRFTGKKRLENLGWNGGDITVRRIHPYTAHVRRVIRRYTVNEG